MSDKTNPETISKKQNPDKRKDKSTSVVPGAVDMVNKLFYAFLVIIGIIFGTYFYLNF